MSDNATNNNEYLVLTDQSGNYFAIPRDVVERYSATGAQREQIEKIVGEDVSGYSMFNQYMNEYRAGVYQAERRDEAARERSWRKRSEVEEAPDEHAEEQAIGIGQMLSGMWRKLPFLKPASPANP